MSRPFSYNDENFTVIGNILFCHIKINRILQANDSIIEIPPEIYNRITHVSVVGNLVRQLGTENTDSYILNAYIYNERGKYYIKTATATGGTSFIFMAYMVLKDI
jgi:hypothetical protein